MSLDSLPSSSRKQFFNNRKLFFQLLRRLQELKLFWFCFPQSKLILWPLPFCLFNFKSDYFFRFKGRQWKFIGFCQYNQCWKVRINPAFRKNDLFSLFPEVICGYYFAYRINFVPDNHFKCFRTRITEIPLKLQFKPLVFFVPFLVVQLGERQWINTYPAYILKKTTVHTNSSYFFDRVG